MESATETARYTAVVHAPDGVRFVASSSDEAEVTAQVVGYVSERCYDTLWPADALAVHALIDAGRSEEAVAAYFATVGQRWDEERLDSSGPGLERLPSGA